MIQIIPSDQRHTGDFGWLQTHWHFSFSDYYDPENMNWGALRVFNDDIVQGGGGFPMHPHRDMEIVTYVLSGALEHKDSMGNKGVVHPGEVQVMSAGKGVTHSEYNHSASEPVHLIQLWILPRHKSNTPRWEQKQFSREERSGKLFPVVSSGNVPGTLAIDQDATIYVSALSGGGSASHTFQKGRKGYIFVTSGSVSINGQEVHAGDQARIDAEERVNISAATDAELMLLDLPNI